MRQAKKERKKIQTCILFILDPWTEIPKKIAKKFKKLKKALSGIIFKPKWDEIGSERGKKILDPNSVLTRPVVGNYEKNS